MAFATSNLQTNSSCIGSSSQACARTVIQVNRSFSRFKYDLRRILPGSDTGGETAKFSIVTRTRAGLCGSSRRPVRLKNCV